MQHELKQYLDTAPHNFSEWLRSVAVANFIHLRRKEAFQMQGRYDGAMSEDCKALFTEEYRMLSELVEWIDTPPAKKSET